MEGSLGTRLWLFYYSLTSFVPSLLHLLNSLKHNTTNVTNLTNIIIEDYVINNSSDYLFTDYFSADHDNLEWTWNESNTSNTYIEYCFGSRHISSEHTYYISLVSCMHKHSQHTMYDCKAQQKWKSCTQCVDIPINIVVFWTKLDWSAILMSSVSGCDDFIAVSVDVSQSYPLQIPTAVHYCVEEYR